MFVLGFSPSGKRLATTHDFRRIYITELPSGRALGHLEFELLRTVDPPPGTFSWLAEDALAVSLYREDGARSEEARRVPSGERLPLAASTAPLEAFSDALDPAGQHAPTLEPFATPLGRARLDVASDPEGNTRSVPG